MLQGRVSATGLAGVWISGKAIIHSNASIDLLSNGPSNDKECSPNTPQAKACQSRSQALALFFTSVPQIAGAAVPPNLLPGRKGVF